MRWQSALTHCKLSYPVASCARLCGHRFLVGGEIVFVQSDSPLCRTLRTRRRAIVLRRRYAVLRAPGIRARLSPRHARHGDSRIAGASVCRRAGWTVRGLLVHSWLLARVPKRSPFLHCSGTAYVCALCRIDGGGKCGAHALDSEGSGDQILLLALVLFGKTYYPRWTVLANPAILLLLSPLVDRLPSPFGAILSGGFTNLSIAVFFVVSVLTTWNSSGDVRGQRS